MATRTGGRRPAAMSPHRPALPPERPHPPATGRHIVYSAPPVRSSSATFSDPDSFGDRAPSCLTCPQRVGLDAEDGGQRIDGQAEVLADGLPSPPFLSRQGP